MADDLLLLMPVVLLIGVPVAVGYTTASRRAALVTGVAIGSVAALFQASDDTLPLFAVPVLFLGLLGAALGAFVARRRTAA